MNLKQKKVNTHTRKNLLNKKKNKNNLKIKEKIKDLIILIKMQQEISDRVFLGQNVSPFENVGLSDAIDKTASNYNDAKD